MKMFRFLLISALLVGLLPTPAAGQSGAVRTAEEIVVAETAQDERIEAIGYNSLRGEFLVVWRVDTGGGDTDLWGRRAALRPEFTWLGDAFAIASTSAPERHAAIAFNPTTDEDYLVVYEREFSASDVDVMGQRVAGRAGGGDNGSELKGAAIGIGISVGAETHPAVAFLPSTQNFLVAFERDADIWARRVSRPGFGDNGGDLIGNAFVVAADFLREESSPAVAASTQQSYFVVTYTYDFADGDMDVRGQRIKGLSSLGDELLGSAFDIAGTPDEESQADIAYAQKQQAFLVVWQSEAAGNQDVIGVWLDETDMDDNPLIGSAFAISDDLVALETSPGVDIDPAGGEIAVALSFAASVQSRQQLGLVWVDPNPRALNHISQSLYLFPAQSFSYSSPRPNMCHAQPCMLLGYSALKGTDPAGPYDAHLLATQRRALALPMILR